MLAILGFGEFDSIMSASAVRQRCTQIGEIAVSGQANWFSINDEKFDQCVRMVQHTCKRNYPDLKIPLHSRWRHFELPGKNLWHHYTGDFQGDLENLARSAIDLVFVSVLLDAGAGQQWRFLDPVTRSVLSRSEGLAAASIELFFNHLAKYDPNLGWSVTADSLSALTAQELSHAFQHSAENHLVGVEGRLELLHGLASTLDNQASGQGTGGGGYHRPGCLMDEILTIAKPGLHGEPVVGASDILDLVLRRFGEMWPRGYHCQGLNLGDCGYHSLLESDDPTSGIVPFHKLSQWLTYSLVEPVEWAGVTVEGLDDLTALPEYRNGGLLLDIGALQPLDEALMFSTLALDSEAVVEWRALTVYLLDRLALRLRRSLALSEKQLPLGSVLQGGTWLAGRELANQLRANGAPPLRLLIDGTVF